MSPYLTQLHTDLEAIIVARWRECPPHYWVMGVPDPYLVLPTGLDFPSFKNLESLASSKPDPDDMAPDLPAWMFGQDDESMSPATAASLEEAERYVEEKPAVTMFDHFGLRAEEFPPAERLTDEQLEALVTAIRRLWAAHNLTAVVSDLAPARVVYPVLLERMNKPAMLLKFGNIGIEFCHYEPAECPWGLEYCTCKDF